MPAIPLLEGIKGAMPFIVDRSSKAVTESRNGFVVTRIPGRFSICDSVNGNNRRYPKKVWEKNLAEGSTLRQMIARNAAFGLLEHPSNGQISLNSPICILVTDAQLKPGKDTAGKSLEEVIGEIMVLGTAEGQKLSALIDAGYNPLVSSRGFGSVLKDSEGVDVVQDDYICEGWDVVLKPSFETAELWPDRTEKTEEGRGVNLWRVYSHLAKQEYGKPWNEVTEEQAQRIVTMCGELPETDRQRLNSMPVESKKPQGEKSLSEDKTPAAPPPAAAPDLKEAPPSLTPASAGAKQQLSETIMDINTIKSRIGAYRGNRVPTDPQRFAEGMNEMASLHQEIANYVAEDAKRSWQGTQLHDEVKAIERAWGESAMAPAKQASKLTESYKKALKITKAISEAAVSFKKKLSEALKQNAEAGSLIETLTQRGQAWVALADKRKARIEELEHKLNVTCEALEIMAGRYHEDVTELGKRVITMEFKEKAAAEDIQKLLKEAKHPKEILAIREKLEPAKPKEGESIKEGEKKDAPKANESKKDSGAPAPGDKPAETPIGEARVLVPSVRSVTESVEMVKRLSAASAK